MIIETFPQLIGNTFDSVCISDDRDMLTFVGPERSYRFAHRQECCENVYIEDVCGDLEDLQGSPIITAEEITGESPETPYGAQESFTWTFYRFATSKGNVTVRWFGTSTGYYSEAVDLYEVGGDVNKWIC